MPIDRYSYEAVELLKDMVARWQLAREIKASGVFANAGNAALAKAAANVPNIVQSRYHSTHSPIRQNVTI